MRLLALATSSSKTSVFVGEIAEAGFSFSATAVPTIGSQASEIYQFIDQVLQASKLNEFDIVAFDAGPGAFTGVRVGCGVAQGLGFAKKCGVIGINALEALAHAPYQAGVQPTLRFVAIDARMGEVYYAVYEFVSVDEPLIVKLSARVGSVITAIKEFEAVLNSASLAPPFLATTIGNGFDAIGVHSTLHEWGKAAHFAPMHDSVVADEALNAQLVAVAARALIRSLALPADVLHRRFAAVLAEPIYIRNKVALDKSEQAELRAANGK